MPARPEPGPTRALAALYSRDSQRIVLSALTGIETEVAASLAPGLEHNVAHARLGWWREELGRAAAGGGAHPLTRQLQKFFTGPERGALAGLRGFVDAATWDLANATFETRRELAAYCARWSAALAEPFAAFALQGSAGADVHAFGSALRELELLCNLAADARGGRVRISLNELDAAGIAPGQLAQWPWSGPLCELVRRAHHGAREALARSANALPPGAQPALRALLVWAALMRQHSLRTVTALPGAPPAGDHHAPLDGWRAWRAARRADTGRFALPAD
ncbi:MAG TPA: squalene/phytoene synthase family protein [Steroidobacteraceae bacterium]|jgi:phytoene synthase